MLNKNASRILHWRLTNTIVFSYYVLITLLMIPNSIWIILSNDSLNFCILPYHTGTKWHERKSCHLEKLLSKRNSNYRNTPYTTNYQISKRHFPTKKYNPYEIYQEWKHTISIHDFFSKRPECQRCKFKALQAYRNSNNCNTPYASCKNSGQTAQ